MVKFKFKSEEHKPQHLSTILLNYSNQIEIVVINNSLIASFLFSIISSLTL